MIFTIATTQHRYRGMDRIILSSELYTKKTKKVHNDLLQRYYAYQSIMIDSPLCEAEFNAVVEFYHLLLEYDIPCEMIAFDEAPLTEVYGREVIFLGIDIVCDMCESYIADGCAARQSHLPVNANGLFCDVETANQYIAEYVQGNLSWKPCWVYQVICR